MSPEAANIYAATRAARKVLVVDLGFLGDIVHLVPALWEIKRAYPAAALHVLTSTVGAEVLQLASCVDRPWGIDMYPAKRSLRQQVRVLRALRRERFDLAVNFSGADRSVFLTALSGARLRVGHNAARSHFWNPWLIPAWIPRQDRFLPIYEQRRQVLRACGLELGPPTWNLRVPDDALRRCESLVPHGAIHFSINASTPLKEWPLSHWCELAEHLLAAEGGVMIVATGSSSAREQDRLHRFVRAVDNERLIALPADLSIPELAAVLRRCRLHVGPDSGVLHLAVAVGVRTISLFRQYEDACAWTPGGPRHRVFGVPCDCVKQPGGPCPPDGPAECLTRISPAEVAEAVREHLKPLLAGQNSHLPA